ncbi:aromatic ring-hydroxylating oxygenase subunit alpha [Yoonia sediminilitoris]|uniref:Phenylpropionate dioxygenase-like ring-hydroxylating dioxygenase large terminal subunit n=1 Tax=Yoonia sediminilitoris TaxID=1286148 RepID=A0A2T6KI68_9RHOB|nr:aromatic ring-hydroxylating dioxygenase subunit alpha [Yoonia sediminilitoris]PUB15419.1 phenylpropionate dioxygenase-like ring-hydroxylating dioxygenase large terminal subunit [Yoonia sediminilitoris]RCW96029.1 phenylpropionate dioxygenase-like ring-hydroxylating dioxygenase large terminal subunit [Yoonia sediminilitoris]
MNKTFDLDSVTAPVNIASGLPNAHYTDPAVFEEEKHAVLFANWAGVGFAKDVPQVGDVKPISFLGMPLLLVRDRDGSLGVFQNTCRHRGMILVAEQRNIAGAIRCPYHSWCYALNGDLRATPHVGGPGQNTHADVNQKDLGLIRVNSYVWNDVVFVNVDGTAPPFEELHSELLERWKEFDQPMHHGGTVSGFALDVATNWKLAVENYCESYHLPWVHPGLNSYSRLEDHYNIIQPGLYSGQGTHVYRQLKSDDGRMMPDFAGLSDKWDTAGEYVAVYPNVLLGVQRDHTFAIVLEPVSLEQTVEHVAIYYAVSEEASPELDPLRAANAAQWKGVFEEDIFVVEGMQKGRHGVLFDGGRFSPEMDGPTHNFHHWVATQVMKGRTVSS